MGKIKFSIITICLNAEAEIESTIRSVLGQSYKDIEYIIIDGKSTDGTMGIVGNYAARYPIKILSEKDSGIYNAMNKGIPLSSGDFVLFLNSGDCFCNNQVLQKMEKTISSDNWKDIYYGNTVLCYNKRKVVLTEDRGKLYKMLAGYMPVHQSVFFAGNRLRNRLFSESYRLRSDFDWLLEAKRKGCIFQRVTFSVSAYSVDGISGRGKSKALMDRETKAIVTKYYPCMKLIFSYYRGIIELLRQKQNY